MVPTDAVRVTSSPSTSANEPRSTATCPSVTTTVSTSTSTVGGPFQSSRTDSTQARYGETRWAPSNRLGCRQRDAGPKEATPVTSNVPEAIDVSPDQRAAAEVGGERVAVGGPEQAAMYASVSS